MKRGKFKISFANVEKINPLFSRCTIYIMYPNENRNGSFISKQAIEDAIPTLFNTPIVGEYIEDKDNFGSHGGKLEISDNGINFIDTTKPYGVVPESANIHWENISDENGDIKEYLVVNDAYLWTGRYQEVSDLLNHSYGQSCEIEILDSDWKEENGDKLFNIKKFIFSALCILGISKESDLEGHVEPAFESASITAYSLDKDEFKKQFNQMVSELKYSLSGDLKMANKKDDKKEHIKIDNSKDAANMTGAWSDVDKTTLRHKLTSASNAQSLVEEGYLIVDKNWEHAPSETLHYPHHQVKDGTLIVHKNGLESAYAYLMANDPNNQHAIDHVKRHYKELGLDMSSFELEGGNKMEEEKEFAKKEKEESPAEEKTETPAQEKKEEKKEKENGKDKTAKDKKEDKKMSAEEYEAKLNEVNEKYTALSEEHEALKVENEKIKSEINELKEFKSNKLTEERNIAEEELFNKFSDELTEDEMKDLKEKASEFSLEDLEEKLFSLAGRKKVKFNFNKSDARINMGLFDKNVESKENKSIWAEQKEKYTK